MLQGLSQTAAVSHSTQLQSLVESNANHATFASRDVNIFWPTFSSVQYESPSFWAIFRWSCSHFWILMRRLHIFPQKAAVIFQFHDSFWKLRRERKRGVRSIKSWTCQQLHLNIARRGGVKWTHHHRHTVPSSLFSGTPPKPLKLTVGDQFSEMHQLIILNYTQYDS